MGFFKNSGKITKELRQNLLFLKRNQMRTTMVQRFNQVTGILMFCCILLGTGCKKNKTPDYPDLIGYWQGQTTQGNPISFKIENKKGTLYITQYNLLVTFGSGQETFQHTNTQGIAKLSGLYFTVSLGQTGSSGPALIDGNFNYGAITITLTGNFSVYYPGSTVDVVTGSYTAYRY